MNPVWHLIPGIVCAVVCALSAVVLVDEIRNEGWGERAVLLTTGAAGGASGWLVSVYPVVVWLM
jgi:hypothetical protein